MQFVKSRTAQGPSWKKPSGGFWVGMCSEDRDRLLMERLLEFDIRLTKQTEGIMQMAESIRAARDPGDQADSPPGVHPQHAGRAGQRERGGRGGLGRTL